MTSNIAIFEKLFKDLGITVIAKEELQSPLILKDTLGQLFEVLGNLEQGSYIIELFQHFMEILEKYLSKKYTQEIVSALIAGCVEALRY
jgi:hypothetical protein